MIPLERAPARIGFAAAIAVGSSLAPMRASAQVWPSPSPGDALEVVTTERWRFERESPVFKRYQDRRVFIHLDSLSRRDGETVVRVSFGSPNRQDGATLVLGPDGRPTTSIGRMRPIRPRAGWDSTRALQGRLVRLGTPEVRLPEAVAWDMLPPVGPAATGTWTDTISLASEREGFSVDWRLERRVTVLGDTVVGDARLRRVDEVARVVYANRHTKRERTLAADADVSIDLEGELRAHSLVDPTTGWVVERADSMLLAGTRTLRLPDGRAFDAPVEWDRSRSFVRRDSAATRLRREALDEERSRTSRGAYSPPSTRLEQRVALRDRSAIDSLLYVATGDGPADERRDAYGVLRRHADLDGVVDDLSLLVGDSTDFYRALQRSFWADGPASRGELEAALPLMENPALAHRWGLAEEPFYENLEGPLVVWRAPWLSADTTRWACAPAACELLARQWTQATEPRLRELGLLARLGLEPLAWADTVLATASPFLSRARGLIRGDATWTAEGDPIPMPASGAGPQAWRAWFNPGPDRRDRSGRLMLRGWSAEHAVAVRWVEMRTGRDILGEVQAAASGAATESETVALGRMVAGLAGMPTDLERIERDLRTGGEGERILAREALMQLFRDAPEASAADAAPLIDRLLSVVIDGADPWPYLHPEDAHGLVARRVETLGEPGPYFVENGVPEAIRSAWSDRVQAISGDAWRARDPRQPSVFLTFQPVRRLGAFEQVEVIYRVLYAREPDESPRGYAGGWTYYLLSTEAGLRAVAVGSWIT